ncbi:transmembrane channel-like protein 8 isoform X4 [Vombatus ursinus]|uniref:transmembrane channel-like protein 8 isoform X4 n=1 Tax=Vombatus ursinus TaxID=29139 RepID=UPI000FFD2BA3|nr:transmembrane channel-like protein 8 isoform X4 [Vombatus ursinus]
MASFLLRQRSTQSDIEPPESLGEELWEEEMERICSTKVPLQALPYAMMDKRLIRHLREPDGVKTSFWEQWKKKWQRVHQQFLDVSHRLMGTFGLWKTDLYEIGGLFGTGIRSYFTFLRFLLVLNLLAFLLTSSLVLLPLAWLHSPDPGPAPNTSYHCPTSREPQPDLSQIHLHLWDVFTGRALSNTYLFYGSYRMGPESDSQYSVRLAYLLSPLTCLLLCFCEIVRRMVKGLIQKQLLSKDYRPRLSSKVFVSWDFCIQSREAAIIKQHSISNEFKIELQEEQRFLQMQQQTRKQRARQLLSYVGINMFIGLLVVGGISAIYWATKFSQNYKDESLSLLLQYLSPGVISLVNTLGPLLFGFLVQMENYPPNTEINLTLFWCVVLKLSSLGMFLFSLRQQAVLCTGRSDHSSCEPHDYNQCDQCWENSVGQELYKLSIFDFFLMLAFAFLITLPRRSSFRPVLGLAGQRRISGTQKCAGHCSWTDDHLDGTFLLPPTASAQQHLHLLHLLCQEVHSPQELQAPPSPLPSLQRHLLLPAGPPAGPPRGLCASALCHQQHSLLCKLRSLLQLLSTLAGGSRGSGLATLTISPESLSLPWFQCLLVPRPHLT